MPPRTRYAKSGDIHVAYQVFGEGPDLVMAPGFISHIEHYWEEPRFARWLNKLGRFCRVTLFDKRGTGLSDRVLNHPGLDERMDDIRAVMDAVGIERAAQFGFSEGGSLAAIFAASHPERVNSLILYGAFARFRHWIPTDEGFDGLITYIDEQWGSGASLPSFAPSKAADSAMQEWWGKFERLGASPSAVIALMRMNREIDIAGILHSIQVPTLVIHRTDDTTVSVEGGRELAKGIPNARLVEIPGRDHIWWLFPDAGDAVLAEMEEFLTGVRSTATFDRVLATVLFTDVVGSTERAVEIGDRRWRDVLEGYLGIVRRQLTQFRGREIDTAGDGVFATFDGPARAIRCASAIAAGVRPLGIEVRTGLHTGECEVIGDKVGGIAVHIGARVSSTADPSEVLVSSTVKDLVAGSGIVFEGRGTHVLKGIPGEWSLYRVVAAAGSAAGP